MTLYWKTCASESWKNLGKSVTNQATFLGPIHSEASGAWPVGSSLGNARSLCLECCSPQVGSSLFCARLHCSPAGWVLGSETTCSATGAPRLLNHSRAGVCFLRLIWGELPPPWPPGVGPASFRRSAFSEGLFYPTADPITTVSSWGE